MQEWAQLTNWAFDQLHRFRGGVDAQQLSDAVHQAGFAAQQRFLMEALADDLTTVVLHDQTVKKGVAVDGTSKAPTMFTLEWYKFMAKEKIAPESSVQVLEMSYFIASLAREGSMTVDSINSLCRGLHLGGVLSNPGQNAMPRCGHLLF